MTLRARETGEGKPVRYRWDLGDGATAEGAEVTHVYLHGGLFPVRLEASGPGGEDVATRVLYVPGNWTDHDRNRPGDAEAFAAEIRGYPFGRMDEESVRVAEFILGEHHDEEALLRLYRAAVGATEPRVRPAERHRMALALGDLERDVKGDLRAALDAYAKAAQTGGRRAAAAARVRQARALVLLGDDPKPAIDMLTELLDGTSLMREDRRLAWIALGEARMALREVDAARAAFEEAVRYSRETRLGADRIRAGAASRKATTYMQAKRWREALDEIDAWEDLDPPARLEGLSAVLRAECEIALGRHAQARRRLRALRELDPRGNYAARALWLIAKSHEAEGDREAALAAYDRLAEEHRDSPLAAAAEREAERLRGR
jgi:tetratricopeptide (TPR) repeat protein